MLEDHRHAVSYLPQLFVGAGGQILAFYQYRPFGGLFQKVQAAHQSALSGAGHTDNPVYITFVDFQADPFEGFHPVFLCFKGFRNILYLYDRQSHILRPFHFRI